MGAGDFSPRFGLAYRASESIVIRGGYGINDDPYPLAFVRDMLGNYPSSINLTVTSPNAFQFRAGFAMASLRWWCLTSAAASFPFRQTSARGRSIPNRSAATFTRST